MQQLVAKIAKHLILLQMQELIDYHFQFVEDGNLDAVRWSRAMQRLHFYCDPRGDIPTTDPSYHTIGELYMDDSFKRPLKLIVLL
jgi:hypothetical protein